MTTSGKIEQYIGKHRQWTSELKLLRALALKSGAGETVKWGAPVYVAHGKNVLGLGAFKNYVTVWFFQGVFLEDKHNKLINAQEGKTRALRQWRFASMEEIDKKLVLAYMKEAIQNAKDGKEIKPQKKKETALPPLLQNALKKDPALKKQFEALAPYKQREFAEHISSAKREATQLSRLDKSIELIRQGIGLHDKYKNC